MSLQIFIDGCTLHVEPGTTILQAARQNGIEIPTLCDYPGLPPHGSCRMCIVEVQGLANTPTACTTPAQGGMIIQTNSPKVQALRREILQMLLSEHPSGCLFCPENGQCAECMVTLRKAGVTTGCRSCPKDQACDLQQLVKTIHPEQIGYPVHYRMLPVEKFDPFFDCDHNLCILCSRCIRVCGELHFASTLAYTNRGVQSLPGTAFHHSHLEAGCSFCGACLDVCPTGALSEKTRKWDGVPDRETASVCPMCSLACSLTLLSKNNRVIGSRPGHPSAVYPTGSNLLCVKGRFGVPELVNHPTRLKQPERVLGTNRLPISWEEAIQTAAEKLAACRPNRFGMLVSAGCTIEDLYVAQKFTREVMRSTNIAVPAHGLYGNGLPQVFQILHRSQSLDILAQASTILCLGLDVHYAQSVVEVRLRQAKARGAQIISISANQQSLNNFVDEWLQPIPGKETELIRWLSDLIATDPSDPSGTLTRLRRAASLLRKAASLAILIGPTFLAHPDNHALLTAVDRLARQTAAHMIALPEQGNLAGSLLLGISSPFDPAIHELDVLYLVGEDVPSSMPGSPFLLYQNIYPPFGAPSAARPADLLLPAAAFTETGGTLVDYSGRIQAFHPAIQPPGEALPTWEILSRIARQLGAAAFDYLDAAVVQAEIATAIPTFQPLSRVDWSSALQPTPSTRSPYPLSGDHTYLGFPLSRYVAGLRTL